MRDARPVTPLPVPAVDRHVKGAVLTAAARAYGYTPPVDHDDRLCGCGHLSGDHHTDVRGCSFCGCTVRGES
jgi:hypothetical protein